MGVGTNYIRIGRFLDALEKVLEMFGRKWSLDPVTLWSVIVTVETCEKVTTDMSSPMCLPYAERKTVQPW